MARWLSKTVWLATCLLCLLPALAQASARVGVVVGVAGKAQVSNPAAGRDLAAKEGLALFEGDVLTTGPASLVRIALMDDSLVQVAADSRMELASFSFQPEDKKRQGLLKVSSGKLKVMVSDFFRYKDRTFQVETPTVLCGVRNTLFAVLVNSPTSTQVVGFDHPVQVENRNQPGQAVVVQNMTATTVNGNDAPSQPAPVTARAQQQLNQSFPPLPPGQADPGGASGASQPGEQSGPAQQSPLSTIVTLPGAAGTAGQSATTAPGQSLSGSSLPGQGPDGSGPPGQSESGPPGLSGGGPPGLAGGGPPGLSGGGPPGQSSGAAPGNSPGSPPGLSGGAPPGQAPGASPGNSPSTPPGQDKNKTNPGNSPTTPPGQDKDNPGNKPDTPPGQDKDKDKGKK